ncbi:GNAT family N-acetyltransferase [Streptomyces sp. WMMC500]|uniref:AtuA-related protein n=1 Tax=Streptomyces sp. WMMC500 TaxID=3015154 RepID=UPI00248ADFA1|nr:GNAT family N-acetyltransferase [Streptomyces sp. WMMC500]WBB64077.1 GNAT family N-acetyltransferase [Streptomyces sp. WMMC500]
MPGPILDDLADVRAGDKGDTLILAVFPRDADAFRLLADRLTAQAVRDHFQPLATGEVHRHLLPALPALTFRLTGVLAGGVTVATTLDGHGKTLGYYLLTLELPPADRPGNRRTDGGSPVTKTAASGD